MSESEDLHFDPATFLGTVRLFPLPSLVLFPHVVQPLHIFEPRYCDLLEDALAGDRLIAMGVLAPGWEKDYEGRPPVAPIACLGRVATHVRTEDGRYNLLIAGVARVALGRELKPTTSFRRLKATIRADRFPAKYASAEDALRRELFEVFRHVIPNTPEAKTPMAHFAKQQVDLATLTDIVAYTLDFPATMKMALLADSNVYRRARLLLENLAARAAERDSSPPFPPAFSQN